MNETRCCYSSPWATDNYVHNGCLARGHENHMFVPSEVRISFVFLLFCFFSEMLQALKQLKFRNLKPAGGQYAAHF